MTEYAEAMKRIVQAVHPDLKAAGFRKRRHTFNRETEPGLIQVVNFQMGPHPIGPNQELPPFRINLYGKFTINLGIFIREIHERLGAVAREIAKEHLATFNPSGLTRVKPDAAFTFVPEYHCELRIRLPELMPEEEWPITDKGAGWWSLDEPTDPTGEEIRRQMNDEVLRYFERLSTRDDFIREVQREDHRSGFVTRAPLSVAVIEFERGNVIEAERLIRDYVAAGFKNPGHREFVERVASSMGITSS